MKKSSAKEAVQRVRVPVARGALLTANTACPLAFPLAAKPDAGGSSVGFCVVEDAKMLTRVLENGPLLCEEYLPGREYSVGVLEGRALPPVELCPVGGVYDYAHKYTEGATDERCPAPVAPHVRALLQTRALIAFSALGLRDYARIDFKENAQGDPVFLEANTLPGMTGTSLLPLAARTAGLSFAALCERMAACAAARKS
jgi:D-alanine-D-alanine ligase